MSDEKMKKLSSMDMDPRLLAFMPLPGKCRCGQPIANARGDEFEQYACVAHVPERRAEKAKQAKDQYDRYARIMRDMITDRVEAAVPSTYAPMQVLGSEVDCNVALRMFDDRISVVDPLALIAEIESAAHALLDVRGMVVLFAGPTGVGKSHAMALLFRYMASLVPLLPVRQNPTTMKGGIFSEDWDDESTNPYVLWKNAPDLFDEVVRRQESLWPLKHVAVLGLDDIGREGTQANAQPVQDIVWSRFDAERTIVTSTGFVDPNVSPKDVDRFLAPLAARYDKAFVRRLAKVPQRVRIIPMLPPEA